MTMIVEVPLWLAILVLGFAAVTFASHFLLPSVRWFFRRRMERIVSRLNTQLHRPVEPFKLLERHDRIQRLIYDPQVLQAVVEHARATGVPQNVAFERTRRYAREIVPGFSASIYFGFSVRVARWLSRLLYEVHVTSKDDDALRTADPDATIIFVMNHRSNMDYVLVTWLVSRRMTLSYAVGEWARVWPLSFLIRAMGAYFVRRRNLNPLYRKVMERYVQMSTAEGVAQAIFPEGGLSLDGRVGVPKVGLLGYVLTEARRSGRDVVFLPVGLSYDRVIEDKVLTTAHETGSRKFRVRIGLVMVYVARMLWRRMFGRWKGFGAAAVSFGQPVSMRAMLAAEPALSPDLLAGLLMSEVRRAIPVLPVPLVACAALSMGEQAPFSKPALVETLQATLDRLHAAEAVCILPDGPAADWIDAALAPLLERGILVAQDDTLRIAPEHEDLLGFHAAPVQQMLEQIDGRAPGRESSGT